MSDPFIGEIRAFGFNFAPRDWAFCDGQILNISQNTALFSLLGTMYGGDGRTTFGLPNLGGRAAMHYGQGPGLTNRSIGQITGGENVTLTSDQMPQHTHTLTAKDINGDSTTPSGTMLANCRKQSGRVWIDVPAYLNAAPNVQMNASAIALSGNGQAHNNMQPYQVVNFCIALVGIYPPRS